MSELLSMEWLRVHVGVAADDPSKDAEINTALNAAFALADSYCNRKFLYAQDVETFAHIEAVSLTLRRYPLASIVSVISTTQPAKVFAFHISAETGLLHLDTFACEHLLTVTYTGGYSIETGANPPDPLYLFPDDLALALVEIFDAVWAATHRTLDQGGIAGTAAVKTVRAGELILTYEPGDTGASVAQGFGDLLPYSAAGILDRYRREVI